MPRKTKSTVRKSRQNKLAENEILNDLPGISETATPPLRSSRFPKIALVILLLAVVAGLLFRKYKSWFIVASVNGQPIWRVELTSRLVSRFGNQLLEQIVGEKLVLQEAAKQNLTISSTEIDGRLAEIKKTLPGSMSLEDSLKLQGVSTTDFMNQVRLQMLVDKMLANEVSVSATEVDDFMKNNSASLTASTDAEKRVQAEQEVHNNKLSQKFSEWFTKLKEAAKVQRYL